ncbi:uncharacterized protein METZ01_LOCUS167384, partial [marine metagenome]
ITVVPYSIDSPYFSPMLQVPLYHSEELA